MLLRRIALVAVLVLPGGLLLVAAAWLVRELVSRERRLQWEKRFHERRKSRRSRVLPVASAQHEPVEADPDPPAPPPCNLPHIPLHPVA